MPLDVLEADVLKADLSQPPVVRAPAAEPGNALEVNWIVTPAGPGSGGHTTIFRVMNHLQSKGYTNRVYFYDVHDGDHAHYAGIVRSYYGFNGPVGRVLQGMTDAHAVVATSWGTAYPAWNAGCSGKRFYFVQDYEPYFYPVGAASILAENTYRMGFHGITAGRWLTEKLRADFNMDSDYFNFGCDTTVYKRSPEAQRSGVVFYARPGAARRAYELGLMAMEIFARRRPDIAIHFYGEKMGRLPFPLIDHGKVSPKKLNEIYNQCYTGLSLSMTNVSLVPHEMLAAGCIPVVNDAHQNRVVLDNPYVRYSPPNPHMLAAEMERVISEKDFETLSAAAANSVHMASWDAAGEAVDRIIRSAVSRHSA